MFQLKQARMHILLDAMLLDVNIESQLILYFSFCMLRTQAITCMQARIETEQCLASLLNAG